MAKDQFDQIINTDSNNDNNMQTAETGQLYEKEYFQQGKKSVQKENYQQALVFFEKCLSCQKNVFQYYLYAAFCYIKLKQYDNTIQLCRQGLALCENDQLLEDSHLNMVEFLITALHLANRSQEINQVFEKYKNDLNQTKLQQMIQNIASEDIQGNLSEQQRREQGQLISQMLENSSNSDNIKQEGLGLYLLPTIWFKKWRKYVFLDTNDSDQDNNNKIQCEEEEEYNNNKNSNKKQNDFENEDEEENNNNNSSNNNNISNNLVDISPQESQKKGQEDENSQQKSFEEEIEDDGANNNNSSQVIQEESNNNMSNLNNSLSSSLYPGPITFDHLVEKTDQLLINPQDSQLYLNYILQQTKQEQIDFIVVTPEIADKLVQIYGGQMLQRYNVALNNEEVKLELRLQKINLINLPLLTRSQDYEQVPVQSLQISKLCSVEVLRQHILETYSILPFKYSDLKNKPFKLWKIKSGTQPQDIVDSYLDRNETEGVYIEANLLKNPQQIEDCELTDQDIIIVEFQQEGSDQFVFCNTKQNLLQNKSQNSQQSQQEIVLQNAQMNKECGNCGKEQSDHHDLQIECSCKYVSYCNETCQRQNQKSHNRVHLQSQDDKQLIKDIYEYFKMERINPNISGRQGLVGLQNLGNTCFMNSSIQCLSNCFELTDYFVKGKFMKDLNPGNPLGTKCLLAGAYWELLYNVWQGKDSYFSPWSFKKVIGKFAPQFSGYSQQDSQELLSYLLDGLHEDLNRVKQKPIVESIESDGQKDNEVAQQSWKNYLRRNQSIIVDLAVGQYKSTLNCPKCGKVSVTFDPFMSISLPLPYSGPLQDIKFYLIFRNSAKTPQSVELKLPAKDNIDIIKQKLQDKDPALKKEHLKCVYIDNQQIHKFVDMSENIRQIQNSNNYMYIMETYDPQIDSYEEDCPQDKLIQIELQIMSKSVTKQLSFSKLFYVKKDIKVYDLYLVIYQYMRQYLLNYFKLNYEQQGKTIPVLVNVQDLSQSALENEFLDFLNQGMLPFEIEYKSKLIDHDQEVKLIDIVKGQKANLKLYFKNEFQKADVKNFKLNTCQTGDYKDSNSGLNIYKCLDQFIKTEVLEKGNEWYCSTCKSHMLANKTMQLQKLPQYLILHLKRFKTGGVGNYGKYYFQQGGEKITSVVDFPLENLDLTKYVLQADQTRELYNYDLVAVSNHMGSMGGGHYTAYCKNEISGKWYDYDDSNVNPLQHTNKIVSSNAYVLFYKRKQQLQ